MRNLLLIVAALLGLYFYQRSPPPPLLPRVAVEPAPTPRLKLYFHSALDAPPMPTGASTGTGHYSTAADSSFGPGSRLGVGAVNGRRK